MSVLPVLRYPDPGLKVVAAPVTAFDSELKRLAADLLDTMRAAPGVGITAPHIGVALRLVLLELTPGEVRTYVNPAIESASSETLRHREGSVSMPGVLDEVERAARVTLRFCDLDGSSHREEAEGFAAACHQHEIDQLDGIVWIDRLSRLRRDRVVARYLKLRRG